MIVLFFFLTACFIYLFGFFLVDFFPDALLDAFDQLLVVDFILNVVHEDAIHGGRFLTAFFLLPLLSAELLPSLLRFPLKLGLLDVPVHLEDFKEKGHDQVHEDNDGEEIKSEEIDGGCFVLGRGDRS